MPDLEGTMDARVDPERGLQLIPSTSGARRDMGRQILGILPDAPDKRRSPS